MPLFAIIYEPGPMWRAGKPIQEQPLDEHTAYQRELHRQGRSQIAGPFLDEQSGGFAVVRAADETAARAIAANDPAVIHRVFVARVRPWFAMIKAEATANVDVVQRLFAAPTTADRIPDADDAGLALARTVLAEQPFSRMLGTEIVAFSADATELQLRITEQLQQQSGYVHGGVLSYLADNALTFAGGAALGPEVVTAELKINYCRPAIGDRLVARSYVVSAGQTQAIVRCDVFSVTAGDEKLCAVAQGTIVARKAQA